MVRRALSCGVLALSLVACGSDDAVEPAGAGGSTGIAPGVDVPTEQGTVHGGVDGATRAFHGIPFAAPPVGDLRLRPPAPPEPWSGVRDATSAAAPCVQFATLGSSPNGREDCLTLDVWAPEPAPESPAPVLVWIHGGGFVLGSGSDAAYDGRVLVEETGAVVVTVNYRLGPLGFFRHPALAAEDPGAGANFGLADQRAALAWVRDNIARFGGDPGRVTLFGESAGGISTCLHLVSDKSRGLFQRAIVESGPCSLASSTQALVEQTASQFLTALGCTDSATVPGCLRGKTVEEVQAAGPVDIAAALFSAGARFWGPVLDGVEFPEDPDAALEQTSVPVVLGTNHDEGSVFVALAYAGGLGEADYANAIQAFASGPLGAGASPDAVLAEYPASDFASPAAALATVLGDAAFVCPSRRLARALARGGAATRLYHFTYEPTNALFPNLGAFHAAEVPFVFGNPGLFSGEVPAEAASLAQAIRGYWSRFAATADPNGGGAVDWPAFAASAERHLGLDLEIEAGSDLKQAPCDFWDGAGGS